MSILNVNRELAYLVTAEAGDTALYLDGVGWRPVPTPRYDVRAFGAAGDGVTDDSAAVSAALTAAESSGGAVLFPPGVYIVKNLVITDSVSIIGSGRGATVLKLPASASAGDAVIVTKDFATLTGGGTEDGPALFTIEHLTIDGNQTNASGGFGLKLYGRNFRLCDLEITECSEDGVYSEWATSSGYLVGTSAMEAKVSDLEVHHNSGHGLNWDGPHDTQFTNLIVYKNGTNGVGGDGIHLTSNAVGCQFTNTHSWGWPQEWAWWIGAGACILDGCVGESSTVGQVMVAANSTVISGGRYFMTVGTAVKGIQIGNGVNVTGCDIETSIFHCESGAIVFNNDGGSNWIRVGIKQTAGTAVSGSPSTGTYFDPYIVGVSATFNGQVPHPVVIRDATSRAFAINDTVTGTIINMRADAGNQRLELVRGTDFTVWSDGFTTKKFEVDGATGDTLIAGAINHDGSSLGFYGTAPTVKPTVSGSKAGNAALDSIIDALVALGLITDTTT